MNQFAADAETSGVPEELSRLRTCACHNAGGRRGHSGVRVADMGDRLQSPPKVCSRFVRQRLGLLEEATPTLETSRALEHGFSRAT